MKYQKIERKKKIVIPKAEFLKLEKGLQMHFKFIPFTTKIKDVEYVEIESVPTGDLFLTSVYAFKEMFEYARKVCADLRSKEFFFHVIGKGENGNQKWLIDFYEFD